MRAKARAPALIVRAGNLIRIALMLVSITQGRDYRTLGGQAKSVDPLNDAGTLCREVA
jgi:hypothetical protein